MRAIALGWPIINPTAVRHKLVLLQGQPTWVPDEAQTPPGDGVLFSAEGGVGEDGPPGPMGLTGATGVAGSPGADGEAGEEGSIGPPGLLGTVSDPLTRSYTPGSFTVPTGYYIITLKRMQITSSQRITVAGTGRWRHGN